MYRKIVWCYIIVLTLLDISLNTKLSAQGKSHGNGVSVHESLMEGISLQEWEGSGGAGAGAGAGAVSLAPAALAFGRRALAAAHALRVTVTNIANETIHLASVAGTTPDFHASFFDSKTLARGANTTFSVVYLGRREGPVHAHLYIHTSKGVHKYPVSAEGAASEWRVWPLVGLRVPQNATLEPVLTLYNPTDSVIQISEVYSSGAWLGLALPGGEGAAPRALWALPPHRARPLVRLRLRAPPMHHAPLQAYIRIKGNMTGGGLVVGVEATPAPAGEFLSPLQLRLRTRGSGDKPDTFYIEAGSSSDAAVRLEAQAWGACGGAPHDPPPPPPPPAPGPLSAHEKTTHNGGEAEAATGAGGAVLTLLRAHLQPRQELARVASLTLDYGKMWESYEASLANGSGPAGAALCAGGARLARAHLRYSLRLLPGTLALQPAEIHFVTCNAEEALKTQELIAQNSFPEPIRITHVDFPPQVKELFHTESLAPLELEAGAAGAVCRVRLRARRGPPAPAPALRAALAVHTNLTDYTVPLLLYEGTFTFEWEWPNSSDGTLRLGTLGAGRAVSVPLRLHNAGPAPLCLTRLVAALPAPAVAAAAFRRDQPVCVEGGAWVRAVLEVRAGEAEAEVEGEARAHTRHGAGAARVVLRVRAGDLRAPSLLLPSAAPYVSALAALELENTMSRRMRVLAVTQPPHEEPHPALTYLADPEGEVREGRSVVGRVQYSPELLCEPHCYTGLLLDTPEGAAWSERGAQGDAEGEGREAALQEDAALQRARYALYSPREHNFTLHLHTDEVARVGVSGSVWWAWPRVWAGGAGAAARAGLCGVGATLPLRLRAANPSRVRPLLLQLRLADRAIQLGGEAEAEAEECVGCVRSASSFSLGGWRVTRGAAHALQLNGSQYLLLQPRAELELTVTFAPADATDLAAYAYLRNNLTILERVLLTGRGAHPAFELAGRKPNSSSPILFEVSECGGAVRRAVVVRNTGRVPLRLREWRVAGQGCAARGFRLQPCAALRLAPHQTKELHLHFAADWTRSRAQATITVMVGGSVARFTLAGLTPARLVLACGAQAGRAPFERALRWAGAALCVLALAGAGALGAADAERALRRHRARRLQHLPRAPLDLRALAAPGPAPPPSAAALPTSGSASASASAPARARRASRRRAAPADPAAERRAFERWRAGVSRDAPPEEESRSEEEEEEEGAAPAPAPNDAPTPLPRPLPPRGDASSSSPDSSPPPRDSYSSLRCRAGAGAAAGEGDEEEEECVSSGEESSSPGEERDECAAREARGARRAAPSLAPDAAPPAAPHTGSRGTRARRESAEARRSERKSAEARHAEHSSNGTSGGGARGGARGGPRKERSARRAAPPRAASPLPAPPRAAPPPPVRWGASWSDVVSRGNAPQPDDGGRADGSAAPLAPIGSDVRRRLGSHSLFYYGGAPPCWPPAPAPPPAAAPAPPAPAAAAPAAPDENSAPGYRSLESLWGSSMEPMAPGAAWLWGAGEGEGVRPPPGFGATRAVRPYDPFQSLASIWTPAALDWRLDAGTPPAPAPADAAPDDAAS